MSRTVQIHGDSAVFPGDACVHCLHPTQERVELLKVKRGTVRRVSVPFCEECIALRDSKSPGQVQFERIAVVVSFMVSWAAGVWIYMSVSTWSVVDAQTGWAWGVLLGLLVFAIVFGVLYLIVRAWAKCFRSVEAKAALVAVTIRDFDWETTTLDFVNEEYAERFELVNQASTAEMPGEDKHDTL
jgi:hypothetical protein